MLAAGVGLVVDPRAVALTGAVPLGWNRAIGGLLLGGAAAYVLLAALYRREVRLFGLCMKLPGVRRTLAQVAVGGLDLVAAAGALYVLLPSSGLPSFLAIVVIYAVAMIAGAISHAPVGMGVFETIVVLALPGAEPTTVLAALVSFRLLYTFIPFVLGAALLVRTELVTLSRSRVAREAAAP